MAWVCVYSTGQEQSAWQVPGQFDFSPQSYQHAHSGTSRGSLQVRLRESNTCPFEHPNLLGSLPKKHVKKNWQSVGWGNTGCAWSKPCGPIVSLPGHVKPVKQKRKAMKAYFLI